MNPDWSARAIAHDVKAKLTARGLDTDIRLAGRRPNALGPQLEVVDHGLHAFGQLFFRWWHDLSVRGMNGAVWQTIQRLTANVHALSHLGDAHQITVIAVAHSAGWHFEVVAFVAAIGIGLAHVQRNT